MIAHNQDYLVLGVAAVWLITNFLGAGFTIRRVYCRWQGRGEYHDRGAPRPNEAVDAVARLHSGDRQDPDMPLRTSERAIVHVVADDASVRDALVGLFETAGLDTKTYVSARGFLATNISDEPGCIVINIRLPDMSGLEFQEHLTQIGVRLPLIMMIEYADIAMSVEAMKRGAFDVLPNPFSDPRLKTGFYPPMCAARSIGSG